jgi:hypothetical protein
MHRACRLILSDINEKAEGERGCLTCESESEREKGKGNAIENGTPAST